MRRSREQLRWVVDGVAQEWIYLLGMAVESPGEGPLYGLLIEHHQDASDDHWSFVLTWGRRLNGTAGTNWVVRGNLLAGLDSWAITSLTLDPAPALMPHLRGTDPIPSVVAEHEDVPGGGLTTHVLRAVPLGLVHDALFVLRFEQVVVADERSAAPVWNLGRGIREGRVPALRVEGLPEARLTLGMSLKISLGLIRDGRIAELTHERPHTDSGIQVPDWPTSAPRKGRPRRTPDELRRFAEDFLRVGGNYQAICEARGKMPLETARGWVKACRAAGWLAPGMPGRRGSAAAGPRLLELLEQGR